MGWGSSTRKGWWPKSSGSHSKVCRPWVSKRGGNLAGMSWTPGGVQKVCAKKSSCAFFVPYLSRAIADVWEKDVWDFQAKSGSSGFLPSFPSFPREVAVQKVSGKTPGSPNILLPDIRGLLTKYLFISPSFSSLLSPLLAPWLSPLLPRLCPLLFHPPPPPFSPLLFPLLIPILSPFFPTGFFPPFPALLPPILPPFPPFYFPPSAIF